MSEQAEKPIRIEMDAVFKSNTGSIAAVYSVKRHKFCTWHYQGRTRPIVYYLFPGYYVFVEGYYWNKQVPHWRLHVSYVRLSRRVEQGFETAETKTICTVTFRVNRLSELAKWVEGRAPDAAFLFKALVEHAPGYHSPNAPPPTLQFTEENTKALLKLLEELNRQEVLLEGED